MFPSKMCFPIFRIVFDNIFDNIYDNNFVVYPLCKESL